MEKRYTKDKDEVVQIRISHEDKSKLMRCANQKGYATVSDYIRGMIKKDIEKLDSWMVK